ncbi:uncharacterized protein LOC114976229 isoform X2 [Acropora millepora]|uniref:uncharacterized protein LOC114976229 isoform X1 n=1 Tax=Acropora millepora TaxID=45264 RepID=UPI001CF33AC7|nr:uncharacterized protein LOC114976229 isoform X1 [Acropora millepora]XP_044178442.1 uncharacterized protein LOC114976229 isoform X2 [Acropora millepora]
MTCTSIKLEFWINTRPSSGCHINNSETLEFKCLQLGTIANEHVGNVEYSTSFRLNKEVNYLLNEINFKPVLRSKNMKKGNIQGVIAALLCITYFESSVHSQATVNPHERDTRSAAPCAVNYVKQGCFNDKTNPSQRTMSELLFQDRYKGKTFSGQKIDWNNWKTYLPELICRCAKAAGKNGYAFFGIQHYGECWSSADAASRFHIYGPNDKCINTEFKSCDNQASDEACSGVNYANYVYEISPDTRSAAPCAVNYVKQGCFNDKTKPSQRTMSELLFQDRYKGKTFSGQKIDWNNWKTYLPELICRCAKAADNKGYEFFGIQHYGECWSSADAASRFHIYGPNDKCINNEFKSCDNLASDEACSGVNYANYVYEIFPRVLRDAPCAVNYLKQGCFNDKTKPSQRTMSELLFQDRHKGKTFSGQKIDWNNWKTYLPELICRCAKAAGKKGYEFFGIQHYGECWSSADAASRFHIYGPNDKCINNEFKSCDNLASDEACSGVNYANYVYEIFPHDIRSAAPCAVNYAKQGCFNDKTKPSQRTMSELLFQDRYKGKTFSGQKIDWNNWKTYLPELICRCAKAAGNKGYEFFGIQHYGECWSSADAASRFHIYGPNDKCINNEFKSCDNLASDEACSGVNYANYVYEISPESPGGSGVGLPINPEEY